jgi:hypothetical protein
MTVHKDSSVRDRIKVRLNDYVRTLSSTFAKIPKVSSNKDSGIEDTIKVRLIIDLEP